LRVENEKVKMRANLLRSVSHDIRTPLTGIVGATSVMLENPQLTEEERRELLSDVREDAQWLIQVVENLLSITRVGSDSAQITKQTEMPEEVMAVAVSKFRKRYPDVAVRVSVPEELLWVPMDAILIEQVLVNLMENAVIHGKTTTEICVTVSQNGSFAMFVVSDNGMGIAEDMLETLFDGSMKHSETAKGDMKRNMGIGLSVCLTIVKAHGGTIQAKNLERGAEFSFVLPLE
ncbi:MAG: GHKL domain-containing protein, partial [Oscillospiraceae bacterium]|nr:GHKL domain-containing protein [Oscillospiraceae bacterium]